MAVTERYAALPALPYLRCLTCVVLYVLLYMRCLTIIRRHAVTGGYCTGLDIEMLPVQTGVWGETSHSRHPSRSLGLVEYLVWVSWGLSLGLVSYLSGSRGISLLVS